jgi:hypothetical protein
MKYQSFTICFNFLSNNTAKEQGYTNRLDLPNEIYSVVT